MNKISPIKINQNNNSPKFGMAIKMHENAIPVLKKQALKINPKSENKFLETLNGIIERQKENPIDIILRKNKKGNKLIAEISTSKEKIQFSPSLFEKVKDLKYLLKAEKKADFLNKVNDEVISKVSKQNF